MSGQSDLFSTGRRAGRLPGVAGATPYPSHEDVAYRCHKCKKLHLVGEVQHYDSLLLTCGAAVFAIRPVRGGPLKLIPSPTVAAQEAARQAQHEEEVEKLLHY